VPAVRFASLLERTKAFRSGIGGRCVIVLEDGKTWIAVDTGHSKDGWQIRTTIVASSE